MFTRVRHKPMRSRVVTHKTAKITMLLRHVHMLVRISITQEGNLFHERLFMKISVDDRSRIDKDL